MTSPFLNQMADEPFKLTKKELEAFGRTIGLELDKRHTKAALIAELKKFTST